MHRLGIILGNVQTAITRMDGRGQYLIIMAIRIAYHAIQGMHRRVTTPVNAQTAIPRIPGLGQASTMMVILIVHPAI
jgi:hypothetical protein